MLAYYQANKKRLLKRIRAAYAANPLAMWPPERRKRANELAIKRSRILRDKEIVAYGSHCQCCGEREPLFLTIDHVENNGKKMRLVHGTGASFYRWLIRHNFPKGFQVLCMSCNLGKSRNGGVCPHKQGSETIPQGSTAKRPEVPSPAKRRVKI